MMQNKDIAIIGISCYFPQSDCPAKFLDNLIAEKDLVGVIGNRRKKDLLDYFSKANIEANFEQAAYLDDIDMFDYKFFSIPFKDAVLMDPCQRMVMQSVYHLFENAGYPASKFAGTKTGIFFGFNNESEYDKILAAYDLLYSPAAFIGNTGAILSGRVAYHFDLKGPNLVVNTACSSSLMAVHLACKSILLNESELAIAGGVQLHLLPFKRYSLGIHSSDGRTRSFDNNSTGTGTGEGLGMVLLKSLSNALEDKDNIYAIIKGSSCNSDAKSAGLTVPSPVAQSEMLVDAWRKAGIRADSIQYIEAHGTGTKLGDPIEVRGISEAMKAQGLESQCCYIGSVKSNMGHLDSASGIAGLIKAALSIQKGVIPASIHYHHINEEIDIENSTAKVCSKTQLWPDAQMRRCGINSFSLSGTNCHVILEEYKDIDKSKLISEHNQYLFCFSAKSKKSLYCYLQNILGYLKKMDEHDLPALSYTLSFGRDHYQYRAAYIAECKQQLMMHIQNELDSCDNGDSYCFDTKKTSNCSNENTVGLSENLHSILLAYLNGKNVAFPPNLYSNVKKLCLPPYVFEKERCWPSCLSESIGEKGAQEYVIDLINKTFKQNVSPQSNFMEIGGDSINAIDLVYHINKKFNTDMLISDLAYSESIQKFIDKLNSRLQSMNTGC